MQKLLPFLFFVFLSSIFSANAQTPDTNGIVYVKPTATGSGNGTSWENATANLQGAIDANGTQKVFVAVGNYNAPANSFVMKNNVEIYGGFNPDNNIKTLNDIRIFPTETLSGSVLNGESARTVVRNDFISITSLNNTAILDGFTVKNGYIHVAGLNGAGILNRYSSPTLRNLVIRDNSANTGDGGGIYNHESFPVITNTLFLNNSAFSGGGIKYGSNNSASAVISNCVFKNNSASNSGPAVYSTNDTKIINSQITDNQGNYAVVNSGANMTLTNVTIANNGSYALRSISDGTATFNNSVVLGTVETVSGGVYNAQYSFIQGNTNTSNGNINTTGFGVNDVFTNPSAGDYTLKSSALINKGNNVLFTGLTGTTKDLAGNLRLVGTNIDLGAYEYPYSIFSDANGIVYVKPTATGNGNGTSWNDATNDLHTAIQVGGVQKVFVAIGTYNVGSSSFIMKNNVAIYGGFDPASGITDLTHNRILPTESVAGSVLNGENTIPLIWNADNGLNNTAVLDGFTLTNGKGNHGGAIYNSNTAPVFNNLVVKNSVATNSAGAIMNVNSPIKLSNSIITNNTALYGGGVHNVGSNSEFTNVIIKNNMATMATAGTGGGGIFNENSALQLTNVLISDNNTNFQGGGFRNLSGNPVFTNVTIANNTASVTGYYAMEIASGNPQINNSIILGSVSGSYTPKYSMIQGNLNFTNGNISLASLTDIFTNPAGANYTLKLGSPAINAGSNALFTNLDANTKDLVGNSRVYKYANSGIIDMGAYESTYSTIVPTSGIVYVKSDGTGNGSNWANATSDLHNAIQTAGVTKVFVATGNYNVGSSSFIMKNGVEIYGGFDPANGVTDLTHNRVMPNASNLQGSILNGQGLRPVIWNVFTSGTAMNNTAVLDGFTVFNGSFSNGAGIRNVYASPTLRNLVIRGNNGTATGAGIYNENSNPDIYNTVISSNTIINLSVSPFANVYGAGVYNTNSSAPTLTNSTITGNQLQALGTIGGAGIYSTNSSPKIYNSIIWNNLKMGNPSTAGADIEGGTITLKNSITQAFTTGNAADNNKVNINPLFAGADFRLQISSPAINTGNNTLFSDLDGNTKDLAGNKRLSSPVIDMGAYELPIFPDANGIIYVKPTATGTGSGNSWTNAISDLHNAIHTGDVQKVFVAIGEYKVGDNSFIMQNNVEIYGGFDPANGITDLTHNRILPSELSPSGGVGGGLGSVLNGQNVRTVIWNVFTSGTALNTSAVLDGFTVTNGNGSSLYAGGIRNRYASPTLKNIVIKNSTAGVSTGGGIRNDYSSPVITNAVIKGNTAALGSAIANVIGNSAPVLTNVLVTGNTATSDCCKYAVDINNSGTYTNVTIAGNNGKQLQVTGGSAQFNNVIALGDNTFVSTNVQNSLISGNTDFTNGNIDASGITATDIFTNPSASDYTLKNGSVAINAGSNALFTGLTANTKDLVGNSRVYNFTNGGFIDLGAYESEYNSPLAPEANGIIYVKQATYGTGSGNSWSNATSNLHSAIHVTNVQKVFVAVGNYNVGSSSFIMKNGVEIYGGFDPDNNIKTLSDNRILPNKDVLEGSVLNGQNVRPVIWNNFTSETALNTSAVLDGFTIKGGGGSNGGGIFNNYASPTLNNLVFKENIVTANGGGIRNGNSSPVISNAIFKNNSANRGGGIFNNSSSPLLKDLEIIENTAFQGGGVLNENSDGVTLINVKFKKNHVTGSGSMSYNFNSTVSIANAEVTGNTGNFGMQTNGGNVSLTNGTIHNNGNNAMNIQNDGTVDIHNSVVLGALNGTGYNIQHSLIEGNASTTNGNTDATGITVNDIFTNASDGDYTLKNTSPVINAGSNVLFAGLDTNSKDLAGNGRVYNYANGGIIDLGAYESTYSTPLAPDGNHIIYVKPTATGTGSGKDWANATSNLHSAIHVTNVQKVFVAVGNYPVGDNSFIMKNGVEIYGGFDPVNGIVGLNDERILPNPANTQGSVLNGQVVRPVIWNLFTSATALNNTAVLDGFKLINGQNHNNGGAVYNVYASPIFRNIIISECNAKSGAGIYNEHSDPTLSNMTIKNNVAVQDGGGIYNVLSSSPSLNNVTLTGNTANFGAGIFVGNTSFPTINNLILKGNTALFDGGGMYNDATSTPIITNSLITENIGQNGAGIYSRNNSSVVLTNTTIAGNTGNNTFYTENINSTLNNSIIYGTVSGSYTAQHSLIEGNTNTANGNLDATGITMDDIFTHPANGNYTLKSSAVVINKGSNTLFTDLNTNTKDLAGNPRTYNNGVIDLGAYEYQGEPATLPVTLINFTAKADGNRAKLQWQTASELNNKGFEIYQSGDDGKFVKIGDVRANYHLPLSYTFLDNTPLNGNNYYQLIQIDNDGKETDLGVRTLNFSFQPSYIQLYPNPTAGFVTLSFAQGTFTQLQVIDINGRLLQQHKLNVTESSKQVSLSTYPVGMYMIKLSGNGKTESRRVVKR